MRIFSSIRHQVLGLLLTLTGGVALVYSTLALTSAFVVEDWLIAQVLESEARHLKRTYSETGVLPQSDRSTIQIYEDLANAPEWVQKGVKPYQQTGEIFVPGERHYHYTRLNLGNKQDSYLVAEVSDLLVVSQQRELLLVFAASLLLALLLAGVAAYTFSNRIVRPLLSLTQAVRTRQFSGSDKLLPQLPHELGYLSNSLQRAFSDVEATLAREKAFATDVSHELRTPLTILKNTFALMEARGFKPKDLIDFSLAVDQMEGTTGALLALARAENLNREPCDLRRILEEEILGRTSRGYWPIKVALDLEEPVIASADPVLVRLLLRNILDNAAQHGGKGPLRIHSGEDTLVFDNPLAQALPQDVMKPGVKNDSSTGAGQGLYVVKRIAQASGWQVHIDTSEQRFRLALKLKNFT